MMCERLDAVRGLAKAARDLTKACQLDALSSSLRQCPLPEQSAALDDLVKQADASLRRRRKYEH